MSVQAVLDAPTTKPAHDSASDATSGSTAHDGSETDPAQHVRTQFLRRVAHDIASPAGVTLTVLDELSSHEKPRPELIAMARRSLRRLMRLSEHLALVAELEANALEPDFSAADIRALAKQALEEALSIDGRKDVIASCDLPATSILLRGDARLLGVTFREVIGNGLRLASSRVEVSLKSDAENVVLRVDDDGPGFAPDALATLGRRFVRRATRGLGLSLSMAMQIVGAHGGTISVAPSKLPPGRRGSTGAAVLVTLPAEPPPAPIED